jgi:nitroimidazol reductase NimA-like FMN-containing flavoprotein (pyridoxamine 5'-phosphate oxidase superfamily)
VADLTMPPEDLDAFLTEERVLRLATLDDEGWPAVVPLWFVWHEEAIWVWNLTRARRTRRLREGTRCAFTVDAGVEYVELRGASGRLEYAFVDDDDVPVGVRTAFAVKYLGTEEPLEPADHHQWIRMVPTTLRSWDFRRLGG